MAEHDDPTRHTEDDIRKVLEESDADIAANRVVPIEQVLAEMRASLAKWRAERDREASIDERASRRA